jgi:hypothetical protein
LTGSRAAGFSAILMKFDGKIARFGAFPYLRNLIFRSWIIEIEKLAVAVIFWTTILAAFLRFVTSFLSAKTL